MRLVNVWSSTRNGAWAHTWTALGDGVWSAAWLGAWNSVRTSVKNDATGQTQELFK